MFDENQIVLVKWCSGNKKYYIDKGFNFTKMGDTFEVPAYMLSKGSRSIVTCICEYCGNEYQCSYAVYNRSKECGKLCCGNCKQQKREETFIKKYGVTSPGASKECREIAQNVMQDKYGHKFAMQTSQGQKHFKETMKRKYGCENPSYSTELQAKAKLSLYNNNTCPTSKPEKKVIEMLKSLYGDENCYPSYPVDKVNLDCLVIVDDIQIDVEYDGLYWHQDKEYDRRRNHWLISKGYKVIRILGDKYNNVPTLQQIKDEIQYILNGHDLGYIDLNKQ